MTHSRSSSAFCGTTNIRTARRRALGVFEHSHHTHRCAENAAYLAYPRRPGRTQIRRGLRPSGRWPGKGDPKRKNSHFGMTYLGVQVNIPSVGRALWECRREGVETQVGRLFGFFRPCGPAGDAGLAAAPDACPETPRDPRTRQAGSPDCWVAQLCRGELDFHPSDRSAPVIAPESSDGSRLRQSNADSGDNTSTGIACPMQREDRR
jgi:hypothetical protein